MKKTPIAIFSIVTVLSLLATPALAQSVTPNPTRQALKQQRQQQVITLRKTNADREIDRRIASLNNLITRLNNVKRLSADQKSTLSSQVNTEITNLQTLKSKIDADTDPATLLTDKKSIVNSYRVFLLFEPKIRIITQADEIIDLANVMLGKTTNSDATSKINDAITQANNAINSVSPLTPDGYPGNKSSFDSARGMLKTARTDLRTARPLMKNK